MFTFIPRFSSASISMKSMMMMPLMPIYMEGTILDLPKIYINGGHCGFLVGIRPGDVARILSTVSLRVAIGCGQATRSSPMTIRTRACTYFFT